MSKWELLKKALNGKKDINDPSSIHRHHGYKVLQKKPIVWLWKLFYQINIDTTWDEFLGTCQQSTRCHDTTQLLVILTSVPDQEEMCYQKSIEFINKFVELGIGRVKTMNTTLVNSLRAIEVELYYFDKQYQPQLPVCKYYQYLLPTLGEEGRDESTIAVYTREQLPDAGIKFSDLFSHRVHGVDNTGNVKVWEAESILTYVLLTQSEYFPYFHDKRVLELGGGSTGLCGLSLASSSNHSCREIVLTDGHPDCVFNQNICLQMCRQSNSILSTTLISCHRLLWQRDDPHNELKSILFLSSTSQSPQLFDCIVASDCLFFKDFHLDLLWILQSALSDNGVIFMLQPKRGDTMDRFLLLARDYFEITIHDNYSPKITELHNQYLQQDRHTDRDSEEGNTTSTSSSSSLYDPDIHYPLLVILRKLPPPPPAAELAAVPPLSFQESSSS